MKNQVNYQQYVYDFAVDGGAVSTISLSGKAGVLSLPLKAVIKSLTIHVVTACTSGGSATVSLGNTASATAYMAATAVASLTLDSIQTTAGVPNVINAANEQDMTLSIAVAALTAGKIEVHVEYYEGEAA